VSTSIPAPDLADQVAGSKSMRFTVETWDPSYGGSVEQELAPTAVPVTVDVEQPADRWAPVAPEAVTEPSAVLFVDGVRRIEARAWIDADTAGGEAGLSLCASYAAGVVCCCAGRSHLVTNAVRRSLVTFVPSAIDIVTSAGVFTALHVAPDPATPPLVRLSSMLQRRMAELELITAVNARTSVVQHDGGGNDLLVVDGPLRGGTTPDRTLGFVKTHRMTYLPADLNAVVGMLASGQRTPVFLMGQQFPKYTWYLRLPCPPGHAWAGIVRVEADPHLPAADAIGFANLSQSVLPRFASVEYKDSRAPQNLYPIAGLERDLRRRLGDSRVLYRALRAAAG